MSVRVEVFAAYGMYVLLYSIMHSCEESVVLGRPREIWLQQMEIRLLNSVGGLLPYLAMCKEVLKKGSSFSALVLVLEVAAYIGVKIFAFSYLKERKVFLFEDAKLPLNPSGHTFMFLNGIFLLIPLAYSALKDSLYLCFLYCVVLYEYNRLLMETAAYHHTFFDVAIGAAIFCFFRAFVTSARKAYNIGAYKNEWKEKEYFLCLLIISLFVFLKILITYYGK